MNEEKKMTPMMQQWHQCKKEAKDAVVLFRLGDFYEAFHEDAVQIARAIDLTLTKRQEIQMCGVPVHTAEVYIDRLLAKGFKVAVVEQTEDPKETKGIVKREIVRIVTPGTLVHSQLLQDKSNNFFLSLSQIGSLFGLSIVDLTTGEFRVMEFDDASSLTGEIYRLRPAEILISERFQKDQRSLLNEMKIDHTFLLSVVSNETFDERRAEETLFIQFGEKVKPLLSNGMLPALSAAGALISHLKSLSCDLSHIKELHNEKLSGFMMIDKEALKSLDILPKEESSYSLLKLLDKTETPMGGRLLKRWLLHPLLSVSKIEERQDGIEELTKNIDLLMSLQIELSRVRDLERLMMRVQSGYAGPRDLINLKISLEKVFPIKELIKSLSSKPFAKAEAMLLDPSQIIEKITHAIVEEPPIRLHDARTFKEGYHKELDELYLISSDSRRWIANYQQTLREELGIKSLKVGYTKAFGYYIDVSSAHSEKVPASFQRKQTLVNSERFISDELKEFERRVLTAEERIKALESALFTSLKEELSTFDHVVTSIARALGGVDLFSSLAKIALEYRYVRPKVSEEDRIDIKGGRHPIIEKTMGFSDFIANDTSLHEKERLYLITGPNMAGKSTYIRQVALITLMAQVGSFVPAASAHIGLVDKIFSRVGASDDISRGQSTFMVEMSQTAYILNNATDRSLVILDEIGRGTSTYDGISIAYAVAEFLLTKESKRAKTLFATHYWELTKMEGLVAGAVNYQVAVRETDEGIVFLHKIIRGGTDKSYGIHVARLAGLPSSCITKAEEMLFELEKNHRKKPTKERKEKQLSLFQNSPIEEELKKLNPDKLTPIDALHRLYELKNKVRA